jgi:hypothetical protein
MSFLSERDRQYLNQRGLNYAEVTSGSQKGIVFSGFALPMGLYDIPQADILVLLPKGFPDVPTDMFYLFPWITLSQTAKYPKAADQPFQFDGKNWQRWSRHNNEWRIGIDGIHTTLIRMTTALKEAK